MGDIHIQILMEIKKKLYAVISTFNLGSNCEYEFLVI